VKYDLRRYVYELHSSHLTRTYVTRGTVAFQLAMRARVAVRAFAFQLAMRAPLCTHVASPSIPRGRLPQGNPRIPLTSTPGASGSVPVEVETSHFEKGKSHELTKHAPTANGAGRRGTRLHGFAVCENDGKRRENKYDLDSKLCLNRGLRRRRSRRHSRARAAASTEARPAPRVSSRLRPAPPRAGSRHTRASGERSSRLRLSERLNLRSRRAEIHDPRVHPEATPVRPASRRR
jgi:hypothetical protein